jgi:cytochrome c553
MHPAFFHLARTLAAAAALLAGTPLVAADAVAGRERAQGCAACHGPKGLATMPNTPHLAGQPAGYLSAQLIAYRSGKRQHDIMSLIAKPLTDDEIASLAAWYASLQVEVIDKP